MTCKTITLLQCGVLPGPQASFYWEQFFFVLFIEGKIRWLVGVGGGDPQPQEHDGRRELQAARHLPESQDGLKP